MTLPSARFLLYLAVVILMTAFVSTQYQMSNPWFFAAVTLFALARPNVSPLKSMLAVAFAGACAWLLVDAVFVFHAHEYVIASILFLVTLVCLSAGFRYPDLYFLLVLVNVLVLVAVPAKNMPLAVDLLLQGIFYGTLIAVIAQVVYWPNFSAWEKKCLEKRVLYALRKVSNDIFACFLQKEYPENIYFFEHRLHLSKLAYFAAIQKLQNLKSERALYLQKLFDILMDMASLRRRVTDHTVFSLCDGELTLLDKNLAQLLVDMQKNLSNRARVDYAAFSLAINAFTNHYQTMLNVAAKEPLAFLLFIASLNDFAEEVAHYA